MPGLERFIGQSAARPQLDRLAESKEGTGHPPLLIQGPPGSGRRPAAMALAESWREAEEPPLDLSAYRLVMDADAPTNEEDRRYAVARVRRQLSRKALGVRPVVLNLESANIEVQNSLLKLLEEPPEQTRFILISGLGGPLDTVRSRCHVIRFRSLDRNSLSQLAEREGWQVQEDMFELAGGSASRLQWLSQQPEVASAIRTRNAPQLAAALYAISEDTDSGVTQAEARRQWCWHALSALSLVHPSPLLSEAMRGLEMGLRPESCLALALLG